MNKGFMSQGGKKGAKILYEKRFKNLHLTLSQTAFYFNNTIFLVWTKSLV